MESASNKANSSNARRLRTKYNRRREATGEAATLERVESATSQNSPSSSNKSTQNRPRHNNHTNARAKQAIDKYVALARDAFAMGDRVAAEGYLQHADHYYRVAYGQNVLDDKTDLTITIPTESERSRGRRQKTTIISDEED